MTSAPTSSRSHRLTAAAASFAAVALLGAWSLPLTAATNAPTPAQAQAQQREVAQATKLLAALRAPKATAEQKAKLVGQLMDLGEEGPRKLAGWADAELASKRPAYLQKFERAAADVVGARVKSAGGSSKVDAEVAELRKASLEVSRGKGLTKEKIHEVCDPAVKKLAELMTVSAEQVMESKPELKAQRQELADLRTTLAAATAKVPAEKRKGLAEPTPAADADRELANHEALAALLATPMTKPDRDVLLANVPLAAKIDPEEAANVLHVNRTRVLLGIGAQAIDPKLCEAARGHSKDMVERKFFDHASPVAGKETPWKRAALAGTSAGGENIYAGSTKGASAYEAWWYSPGHHANMTGKGTRIGVGREKDHFTQMFGG